MSSSTLRRAAALGLALVLAVPAAAAADTVLADGDALTPGSQMVVHLGEVVPGASVPVDVALRLTCKNSSHVAAGSTVVVAVAGEVWPGDGTAASTPGSIDVPADWPAPGTACPAFGQPTILGAEPVHLDLTAPTTPGTGYEFTFVFAADAVTGISNTIPFSATIDVVAPGEAGPPADTTAPVLAGLPTDLTVFTPGTSAIASWPAPTAIDDTDPSPLVSCDPASGSAFPLGTTTVTCTATDETGNASAGTFTVTVRQLSASWGRPLHGGTFPALTGRLGRTIPLKLSVLAGGVVQGPAGLAAPSLRLERLDACTADAGVVEPRAGGTFRWDDAAWHRNLRTSKLAPGCWRLVALVDGSALSSAVVRLTAGGQGAARSARNHRRCS